VVTRPGHGNHFHQRLHDAIPQNRPYLPPGRETRTKNMAQAVRTIHNAWDQDRCTVTSNSTGFGMTNRTGHRIPLQQVCWEEIESSRLGWRLCCSPCFARRGGCGCWRFWNWNRRRDSGCERRTSQDGSIRVAVYEVQQGETRSLHCRTTVLHQVLDPQR
jgi:hypothetical protein